MTKNQRYSGAMIVFSANSIKIIDEHAKKNLDTEFTPFTKINASGLHIKYKMQNYKTLRK